MIIVIYLDGKYDSWDTKHKRCNVQQSQDGGADDWQDEEVMRSRVVGSREANWLECSLDLEMGMEFWYNSLVYHYLTGLYHVWCCLYAWLSSWHVHILGLARLLDILNWSSTLLDWNRTLLNWNKTPLDWNSTLLDWNKTLLDWNCILLNWNSTLLN